MFSAIAGFTDRRGRSYMHDTQSIVVVRYWAKYTPQLHSYVSVCISDLFLVLQTKFVALTILWEVQVSAFWGIYFSERCAARAIC